MPIRPIRPILSDDIAERAALNVRRAKQLAQELQDTSEKQRKAADDLVQVLMDIQACGSKNSNEKLIFLLMRLDQNRALRNSQEWGSFLIETSRTMEMVWEELCRL